MLLMMNLRKYISSENLHCISTGNLFPVKFDFDGYIAVKMIVSEKMY